MTRYHPAGIGLLVALATSVMLPQVGKAQAVHSKVSNGVAVPVESQTLGLAAGAAEKKLHQSFANLHFEDFGPSPIKGPIYQANAGGRILYFAPESGHLIFAAVYDKDGVNLTALAQDASLQKRLGAIDAAQALAIGPAGAPTVIEFTDPECPYCRALEKFWNAKAAEGKPVRQLVYFVTSIHPGSAAKVEHILCSPDKEKAFHALYAGAAPDMLLTCREGHAKVVADAALTAKVGVSGTPTLIIDNKLVAGFQQGELEHFLDRSRTIAAGSP